MVGFKRWALALAGGSALLALAGPAQAQTLEDALVLARTSSKVTIVHRRDDFHRASFVLSEKVKKNSKINILWNSVVKEFVSEVQAESGKNVLTKVRIETTSGGDGGTVVAGGVDCKGAFVAIGHDPNTKFLKDLLEMDSNGYLETHARKPLSKAFLPLATLPITCIARQSHRLAVARWRHWMLRSI